MTNSIYDALPIVANAFGEQIGVKVELQSSCAVTAHTNDSVITLPMIASDSDSVDALWGLLYHEAGHHKWTEFVHDQEAARTCLQSKPPFFRSCWNVLEDVRMEGRVIDDLPGSRGYLTAAVIYMQGQGVLEPVQVGDPLAEVVGGWLLGRGRTKALGQPLDALWQSAESLLKAQFGEAPIDEIGAMIDRASTCETSMDVVDLVDEIFGAFRALFPESEVPPEVPPEQGEQGECEGEGEGGTSQQGEPADTESTSSTPSSESESESSENEGEDSEGESDDDTAGEAESGEGSGETEGEQESTSLDSSGDQSYGTSEESQSEDGELGGASGSNETGNESADGETGEQPGEPETTSSSSSASRGSSEHSDGDVMSPEEKAALRQAIEEMIEQGVLEDVFDQLKENLSHEAQITPSPRDYLLDERNPSVLTRSQADALVSKVESQSNAVALELRSLIQSENRTSVRNTERGRRINSRKLARLSQGDARVFRKPDYREAPNTAIHLLVDVSGSMYDHRNGPRPIDIALEATLGLALALESIEGTSIGITAFDDEAWPILKQGESVHLAVENFGESGSGWTGTHKALLSAAQALSTCREPRKIIFVITDGEPDNRSATIKNVKRCEAAGIEVMAIGIRENTALHDYDLAECIENIDDLHRAVFGLMQHVMGGSNVA